MRRVNLRTAEFDHSSERDGFRWSAVRVGRAIGAEQIGGCLYELGEGQLSFPFHFHHGMEEWVIVVEGTPTLRDSDSERVLRAGDVVCFPVGPEGAHQLRGPGKVLIVSASRSPESIEYPDSHKIGVRPPGKIFREADATDYWEGE